MSKTESENPEEVQSVKGYLLKYGDEYAGAVFTKDTKIRIDGELKKRASFETDEQGLLATVELLDGECPEQTTVYLDRRVDVNLRLGEAEVEHLLSLVTKQKFDVNELLDFQFTKALRDKLRGFKELPLVPEIVPPEKEDDPLLKE